METRVNKVKLYYGVSSEHIEGNKDSLLFYKELKTTTKVICHVAVYLSSQLHNTNPAVQKGPLEFLEEFLFSVLMELLILSEVLYCQPGTKEQGR